MVRSEIEKASELATSFMRSIVKTARKIGAQAIGVTNELDDYETEAGRTFWRISTQKLFLPQSNATKSQIKRNLSGELSEADTEVISDLKMKKGHYSEGYLMNETSGYKGSFLIPLSKLMFAIVSTDADVEERYSELRQGGYEPWQAVTELSGGVH